MITFDEYLDNFIDTCNMDIKYVYERKFLAKWLLPHYQQLVAAEKFKKEQETLGKKYVSIRSVKYEPVHIKSDKFIANRKGNR